VSEPAQFRLDQLTPPLLQAMPAQAQAAQLPSGADLENSGTGLLWVRPAART
jgi:hypothetical protein